MSKLIYADPETGEDVTLDVTDWQFVIDTESGEVCRLDLVNLALLVSMNPDVHGAGGFRYSLLTPPGFAHALYEGPPDWWIDVRVERRAE